MTALVELDEIDKKLLQLVQDEFPIVKSPWKALSRRLKITEKEALSRIKRLYREGAIRKIAPILETRKVGLNTSTLILMKVPEDKIEEIASIINEYGNVSHNYQREHEYNLWFTIASSNENELKMTIKEIKQRTGVPDAAMLDLPTLRRFKIGVQFQFT